MRPGISAAIGTVLLVVSAGCASVRSGGISIRDEVRVRTDDAVLRGRVVDVDSDGLTVRTGEAKELVPLAWSDVTRLERARQPSWGVIVGGWIAGAAAGTGVAYALVPRTQFCPFQDCSGQQCSSTRLRLRRRARGRQPRRGRGRTAMAALGDRPRRPGSRPPQTYVFSGTVDAVDDAAVFVRSLDSGMVLRIDRNTIERLQVARGHRRATVKGLAAGAGALGGIAMVDTIAELADCQDRCAEQAEVIARRMAVGAGIGALIGGLLGYGTRTTRWEEAGTRSPQVLLGVAPRQDGAAVVLAVRF